MIESKTVETKTDTGSDNPTAQATKKMSITAKVGTKTKTISFPIPHDFEAWMCAMRDCDQIEVDGNNHVKIRLEIFTYNENF